MEENTILNSKLVTLGNLSVFWENISTKISDVDNKIGARSKKEGNNVIEQATGIYIDIENIEDSILSLTGGVGSIADQITTAINKLDVTDTAVEGQYVSSVSETDGKITVTRAALPAQKEYSIVSITGDDLTNLGANVKEAYKLVVDGVQTGDTIKIYKDSSLKDVNLVNQELVFTYILANGTEKTEKIDVSTFLAESEFKNGLEVDTANGTVAVKIDATSEFLTVSETGIKVSGVQDAIDTAKSAAESAANSYTDTKLAEITLATDAEIIALFTA